MALTIASSVQQERTSFGSLYAVSASITFDSSYPTDGESLTPAQLGLSEVYGCWNLSTQSISYVTKYNQTTQKLQVYGIGSGTLSATFNGNALAGHDHNAQPINAELQAVAADTCTLNNLPAAVSSVTSTAGGVTGGFIPVADGVAPATGEVSINFATGVLTFNAGDAVTACRVAYIPLATTSVSAGTPAGSVSISGAASETEVPNGTDLSAVTVSLLFLGR